MRSLNLVAKHMFLICLFCCIVVNSQTESPQQDPFGFYCAGGIGDYQGIDEFKDNFIVDESKMPIPTGEIRRTPESFSSSNIYDTYSADQCQRVRRPWNSMSTEDRQLYINGLLELRARGELNMNLDELVAIASVHDNPFGSVTHQDSDYLFWHGYLVWELESRIRNLGGEYSCFGMPYWDWTDDWDIADGETPHILETGLGGYGDPNNYWTVNGFSWDITTEQYWTPYVKESACKAKGDVCPICAMKRAGKDFDKNSHPPMYYGQQILEQKDFISFQRWILKDAGLPHEIDNSYDPIWYLFHSMESYYQAMWVNCHDYDQIDPADLGNEPMAFTAYCDESDVEECVGIALDDPLYFSGVLAKRPWSFIHNEKLTIHKLYYLPKWNIVYDLNGDDFFENSGLKGQCKDKLNSEWFILPEESDHADDEKLFILGNITVNSGLMAMMISVFVFGMMVFVWKVKSGNNKESIMHSANWADYGSVVIGK